MTAVDVTSLFASIASVILAIVAIWLSIAFFRMSSQLSEGTREAAKGIGASVERLEKLFDKLYADTFSMMRDTVSDMRKHMWPDNASPDEKITEEAEKRAEEKTAALKEQIQQEVGRMLHRQRITDEKVTSLSHEMQTLLERAISGSRRLEREAREETLRDRISRAVAEIRQRNRSRGRSAGVTAGQLVDRLEKDIPPSRLILELEKMAEERRIGVSERPIGPDTLITFGPADEPRHPTS